MATGKIARLPRHIRNLLSKRLDDGEIGAPLLKWLNALPEVKTLCQSQFNSVPVSKQNVSDYKQGPHQQWLRSQEACELVENLAEEADDLAATADGPEVSDLLGSALTVELARMVRTLLAETTDTTERWQRLREVMGQLAQLRREDHRAQYARIASEQWELEQERLQQERHRRKIKELKRRATAPVHALLMKGPLADALGGGKNGRELADFLLAVEYELPVPHRPHRRPGVKSSQARSRIVKDSQG